MTNYYDELGRYMRNMENGFDTDFVDTKADGSLTPVSESDDDTMILDAYMVGRDDERMDRELREATKATDWPTRVNADFGDTLKWIDQAYTEGYAAGYSAADTERKMIADREPGNDIGLVTLVWISCYVAALSVAISWLFVFVIWRV